VEIAYTAAHQVALSESGWQTNLELLQRRLRTFMSVVVRILAAPRSKQHQKSWRKPSARVFSAVAKNENYHGTVLPSYARKPPLYEGEKRSSTLRIRLAASSGSDRW
jgi:hypothetical protein